MIIINYVFAFFGLLFASYFDVKTREVPDWLNFSLVGLGLGTGIIYSLVFNNFYLVLWALIGFAAGFILAYLMYYTGQWGGGDSKMIMALGALIGINLKEGIPILLTLLTNILLVGAVYGLIWSIVLAAKHARDVKKSFKKRMASPNILFLRKAVIGVCVLGLIIFFLTPFTIKIPVLIVTGLLFFMFYLWLAIKTVEEVAMVKSIPIEELTEGDWVLEEVFVNKKRICGPKDLGLSKEQINKLIKLKKAHKMSKIKMKIGIPFIPSFFIAFIVLLIFGNWLAMLI